MSNENVPAHIRVMKIGAQAVGALAVGALAIGALAIGALAIGRLVIGRSRIRRLEIDELVVARLHVTASDSLTDIRSKCILIYRRRIDAMHDNFCLAFLE